MMVTLTHERGGVYGGVRVQHAEYMAALYCNRAAAQVAMGRAQKAFEDCTKSLEFKPHDNLRALLRRARASQTLGNYRSALADLEAVEALLPAAVAAGKGGEVNAKDLKREVSFCQAQAAKQAESEAEARVRREAEEAARAARSERETGGRTSAWWHWEQGRFAKMGAGGFTGSDESFVPAL